MFLLALLLVLVDFVALVIPVAHAGCGKHAYLLYCWDCGTFGVFGKGWRIEG